MSTISSTGSFGAGTQIAIRAIQSAEADFEHASRAIQSQLSSAGQSASSSQGNTSAGAEDASGQGSSKTLVAPPNPGPPGGARPADLAEAMAQQDISVHQISANVKTLRAFDEMLGEVLRVAPNNRSGQADEA